jgi:hypothetical protein
VRLLERTPEAQGPSTQPTDELLAVTPTGRVVLSVTDRAVTPSDVKNALAVLRVYQPKLEKQQ